MNRMPGRRAFLGGTAASLLASACHPPPLVPSTNVPGTRILHTDDGDVPIDARDPQRGPANPRVVLVVFSDFQCNFCNDAAHAIDTALASRRDVLLVYKHFPLGRHLYARAMALVAQAVFFAKGNEAFWRAHDRLFALTETPTDDVLLRVANEAGASREDLAHVVDAAAAKVADDVSLGHRLGVDGTPQLYVNRHGYGGAPSAEALARLLDDA